MVNVALVQTSLQERVGTAIKIGNPLYSLLHVSSSKGSIIALIQEHLVQQSQLQIIEA